MVNNEKNKTRTEIIQFIKNKDFNKMDYLNVIVKVFNTERNQEYDFENLSIDQEVEIQRWLYKSGIYLHELKIETYRKMDWFLNEEVKKDYLKQFHCKSCDIDNLILFSIRISPMSRQIKSELKNKFQEKIKSAPYVANKPNEFSETDRICLKLIFVINESRDKDVDNMAKITLDGLKGTLIPDDKQIDHLEIIKFKANYLEEHITISIGRSHFNEHENILFRGINFSWAGTEKIIIDRG